MSQSLRLGVNIDHVATVRNARGGAHPDPVRAALAAMEAGADGITAHLREDRRHISDSDIARLKAELDRPLNLEMAITAEMLKIALGAKPNACCLVPERREERTTEGGLNVLANPAALRALAESPPAAGPALLCFGAAHAEHFDRRLRQLGFARREVRRVPVFRFPLRPPFPTRRRRRAA